MTLSSSAASVTFSSISQAYRDLVLVVEGTTVTNLDNLTLRFNADTGSNYNRVGMGGNGTTATSSAATANNLAYLARYGWSNTTRNLGVVNVLDYSATDKHKSFLSRVDTADTGTGAVAGRWASTSAITSILVFTDGSGFASGSTFALYGIAA